MISGLYKYIVFDPIERSTGKVYDEPCHRDPGPRGRPAEHRLGRARTTGACRSTTGPLRCRPCRRSRESPRHRRRRASSARTSSTSSSRSGHEPRIFDLVPSPHHEPGEIDDGARRPRAIATRVRRAVRGCDAIIHLAAVADVDHVVARPDRTDAVNVARHAALLEAARAGGSRGSSTRARSGSTATRRRRAARRGHAARAARRTSTRRPSSRARCTAAPTASSTGSSTRSCASASRTGRARGRRPSCRRSSPRRSAASR